MRARRPSVAVVRVLMLAAALWSGSGVPALAADAARATAAVDAPEASSPEAPGEGDPCAGCPDEDAGRSCPPTCSDCGCLPFTRSVPARGGFALVPPAAQRPAVGPLAPRADAPVEPQRDGVFHPPRA